MTVSIVIPLYNVEKYICRCLDSVKRQTYTDYEVVVVDDCGKDNSVAIAADYLQRHFPSNGRIVHHEHNRGLSAARNTGLMAASGKYVYFLDSDDTISETCLEDLTSVMADDIDYAMAKYENVPVHPLDFQFRNGIYSRDEIIEMYQKEQLPWNAVNRLIRRSFMVDNDLLFVEGILSEDLMWNFMLLPHLSKVAIVDKVTYFYYVNPNSIMTSSNYNYKYVNDLLIIGNKMQDIAAHNPQPNLIRYYHFIKYDFIPYAILWHKYPSSFRYKSLKQLYTNRFHPFYRHQSFGKKLLFLLPTQVIALWPFAKFYMNEYTDVLLHKLHIK